MAHPVEMFVCAPLVRDHPVVIFTVCPKLFVLIWSCASSECCNWLWAEESIETASAAEEEEEEEEEGKRRLPDSEAEIAAAGIKCSIHDPPEIQKKGKAVVSTRYYCYCSREGDLARTEGM